MISNQETFQLKPQYWDSWYCCVSR